MRQLKDFFLATTFTTLYIGFPPFRRRVDAFVGNAIEIFFEELYGYDMGPIDGF